MDEKEELANKANVQNLKSALPFWRQLHWNLMLYFMALAVSPLVIVITIILNRTGEQAKGQIERQLESVAELKIDQIDRWLSESDLALEYFLSAPIRSRLVASVIGARLDEREQKQLNDILGKVIEGDETDPRSDLQFIELFVYNSKGEIVAASDLSRVGQIVANQPYFAASMTGALVQSPFYELGQSELTMIISKPLRDDQSNQIVGVLAGRLNLNALSEIMISRTGLGETGETYLVSLENNYLVTSSRFENEGYSRTRAYHSEGIDRALGGENGAAIYPGYREPAVTVIGVYRWLPDLKVGLLAEVAETEALAPFVAGRNFSLGVALAAILIASGVGLYSASRISRPIASLTQVANRIAEGDLTQQAEISQRNEIGLLAATFNEMTGQLRRLFDTLEDRNRRLEIVANLGERLSAILNLEELLAALVNQVKDTFGYYHVQVYLLDEQRQRLVVAEGTGAAGVEMKAKGHSIPLDAPASLMAGAARSGEIVRVDNVREAADWLPNPLLPDTYSKIVVPITLGLEGQVVGVLDVQSDKIAGLGEGDVNLLRTLANQVAVAIHNARLFHEVETALAEARAAQERYLEQAWDKRRIVTRGGQYCYIRPDAPRLDEAAIAEAKQQALFQKRPAIVTIRGKSADRQNSDVGLDIQTQKTKPESGNSSALVAPVTLGNRIMGTLQLHRMNSTNKAERGDQGWTDQELGLIEAVLDQAAQIAETLRLFEETRERAGQERIIREITDKLRAATNLDSLLETAARELGQQLGVRHTILELGIEMEPLKLVQNSGHLSSDDQ